MKTPFLLCLVTSLVALGCGDDDDGMITPDAGRMDAQMPDTGTPDAGDPDTGTPPGPATASFNVAADGAPNWLDVPFPSDLYLDVDGKVALGSSPLDMPLWDSIVETLSRHEGFCRNCVTSFGIEGFVDPSSLPADAAPDGTAAATDSVLMLSLASGELIPVEADYNAIDGAVTVKAAGWRVLDPGESFVVALTSDLLATDGTALQATAQFVTVRDMADGGPEAVRARAVVGPGLDALATAGVDRSRIVAATVFTTRDTGTHLSQIAAVVEASPAPVATVDRVFLQSDGTLDELMGTPGEDRPGYDTPAAGGTEGDFGIKHDAIGAVILGRFQAPRIVEGSGTEIGFVTYDASGAVMAGAQEEVPFLLVIPNGADDIASLPIAIAHTGNPGTRDYGLIVGNTLAEIGIATLTTDPFQMGERAESATDADHNVRGGDLGPDGLSEHDGSDVRLRYQGVAGSAPGLLLHPGYAQGASSQITSDAVATIRFVEEGDISAVAAADGSLTGLNFDTDNIFWMGLSNGSYTGMTAIAARSGVDAAVFNVGPGSIITAACHAPGLRGAVGLLLGPVGVTGAFDEVDRRLCMNPLWSLYQNVFEDIDAVTALYYLFEDPLYAQSPPDVLFQYAGLDETISQVNVDAVLAEAGVPTGGPGPHPYAQVTMAAGPFTANRTTPNGTITAGGWFFPVATHTMLIDKNKESGFEPPIATPFVPRDMTIGVTNPIESVHGQFQDFFSSYLSSGRATITAPP